MHFGKGITAAALGPASLRPHVAGAAASMLRRLLLQPGCSAVSAVRRRSGLRTGLQWRCSVPSAPPCMHRTLHPPSSMQLHSFSTLHPTLVHCGERVQVCLTWYTLQVYTLQGYTLQEYTLRHLNAYYVRYTSGC